MLEVARILVDAVAGFPCGEVALHRVACRHRRMLDVARQGIGVGRLRYLDVAVRAEQRQREQRSEEHTSELQSLMRISYAVFCLKKKTTQLTDINNNTN